MGNMVRTQIFLTAEQRRHLRAWSRLERLDMLAKKRPGPNDPGLRLRKLNVRSTDKYHFTLKILPSQ